MLEDFVKLFQEWSVPASKLKMPRGLVMAVRAEPLIAPSIAEHEAQQRSELEQLLFAQRKRLADAERKLQDKPTNASADNARIATSKIEWALGKLTELCRTEPNDDDLRIYPRHYAPVMVWENDRRVVRPMRYQLRPAGKPAFDPHARWRFGRNSVDRPPRLGDLMNRAVPRHTRSRA